MYFFRSCLWIEYFIIIVINVEYNISDKIGLNKQKNHSQLTAERLADHGEMDKKIKKDRAINAGSNPQPECKGLWRPQEQY